MSQSISVLILSFNDELCIHDAIASVASWSDDVVVLDSNSTDSTVEIIKKFPSVRCIANAFIDFSTQRNFGLKNIQYKHEWLFMLDADECCPPALKEEMLHSVANANEHTITFSMKRRDIFNGKWVRAHYDMRFTRLMRHEKVNFVGLVHEKLYPIENCVSLSSFLLHYPFSKGVHNWVQRHSLYAVLMAELEIKNKIPFKLTYLFSSHAVQREKAKKALFQRMPGRVIVYFLYKYLYLRSFLDGAEGLLFVLLESFYHVLVIANIREKKTKKNKIA